MTCSENVDLSTFLWVGFGVIDMSQGAGKITHVRFYFADDFLDGPLILQIESR